MNDHREPFRDQFIALGRRSAAAIAHSEFDRSASSAWSGGVGLRVYRQATSARSAPAFALRKLARSRACSRRCSISAADGFFDARITSFPLQSSCTRTPAVRASRRRPAKSSSHPGRQLILLAPKGRRSRRNHRPGLYLCYFLLEWRFQPLHLLHRWFHRVLWRLKVLWRTRR